MDTDSIKLVCALLAGVLGLAGGLLTFMNGRLNDAKTDEAKEVVYQKFYYWIGTVLFFLGTVITTFLQFYAVACGFYLIAFVIQTYLFLSRTSPVSRTEMVVYSLQTTITMALIILSFVFSMFNRIIAVQEHMIDAQIKTVDALGGKGKP